MEKHTIARSVNQVERIHGCVRSPVVGREQLDAFEKDHFVFNIHDIPLRQPLLHSPSFSLTHHGGPRTRPAKTLGFEEHMNTTTTAATTVTTTVATTAAAAACPLPRPLPRHHCRADTPPSLPTLPSLPLLGFSPPSPPSSGLPASLPASLSLSLSLLVLIELILGVGEGHGVLLAVLQHVRARVRERLKLKLLTVGRLDRCGAGRGGGNTGRDLREGWIDVAQVLRPCHVRLERRLHLRGWGGGSNRFVCIGMKTLY